MHILRLGTTNKNQKDKLKTEIDKAKSRIVNARRLLPDKEVDAAEYKEIKNNTGEKSIGEPERKIRKAPKIRIFLIRCPTL